MEHLRKHGHNYVGTVLLVLGIAILTGVVLFFVITHSGRRMHASAVYREFWSAVAKRRAPLTASNVNLIRPWMTFDYVNRTFDLPNDVLKTDFAITDARYPYIPLGAYARQRHETSAAFTSQVREAVKNYVARRTK